MSLNTGWLRQKVIIQKPESTANSSGGFTVVWVDFLEEFARVRPLSSRENFFAQQTAPSATHEVTMHWRPGITQEMRVKYIDRDTVRFFQIRGIRNLEERDRQLVLQCEESPTVAT